MEEWDKTLRNGSSNEMRLKKKKIRKLATLKARRKPYWLDWRQSEKKKVEKRRKKKDLKHRREKGKLNKMHEWINEKIKNQKEKTINNVQTTGREKWTGLTNKTKNHWRSERKRKRNGEEGDMSTQKRRKRKIKIT